MNKSDDLNKLEKKISDFENKGYLFFKNWTDKEGFIPDRIKFPSGKFYDINDINIILTDLKSTEKEKLYCNEALEYLKLIKKLSPNKINMDYSSFMDNDDIRKSKKKYS